MAELMYLSLYDDDLLIHSNGRLRELFLIHSQHQQSSFGEKQIAKESRAAIHRKSSKS
jgi:hypothetical protein